jgi:hypothetical protein
LLDDQLSDVQPSDLQLIGKIAVLGDPQGTAFAVFEGRPTSRSAQSYRRRPLRSSSCKRRRIMLP